MTAALGAILLALLAAKPDVVVRKPLPPPPVAPVASVRISEPPYSRPLPVSTPVNSLVMRLYWPNI